MSEHSDGADWGEIAQALARALGEGLERASGAAVEALGRVDFWLEAARPAVRSLERAALAFRDAYDEGVPSGWRELNTEQIFDVIDLMQRTGWCLTTSPPPRTLVRLIEAPDDSARKTVLLGSEAQILNDLDVELRAADAPLLAPFSAATREAWEAHAGGLYMASQALSSTTIAALSHGRGPLAHRNLGAARGWFNSLDIEKAGLREIRFFAVAGAVGTVLHTFPNTGPEPDLFNRNATAHLISNVQFNQFNSLTALMLTCGWLREVMWLQQIARENLAATESDRGGGPEAAKKP